MEASEAQQGRGRTSLSLCGGCIVLSLCPSRGRLLNPCPSENGVVIMVSIGRSFVPVSEMRITCECNRTLQISHTQRCIKEASDWLTHYDLFLLLLMLVRGIWDLKGIRRCVLL
jgi:hypothetical protein